MKNAFVVALFLTLAAPALAQGTGQGAVGAAFGGAAPVGLLHDELDPSFAVSGFGTWPVSGLLSVRVSGAYDGFRPLPDDRAACTAAGFDCRSRIGRLDGGIEIGVHAAKARPYGFFELGAYNFKQEAAVGSTKISESKTNLGGGFGGGVRIDLARNWGVGAELPFRWWQQKEEGVKETYWYVEPGGFVYFRFGH
ncbi:MAG: hypothetical protein DMF86_13870 [Acidobacteria bacterium]|nr:MAG: hypothetical protein DMF86_13870 [Acidobacteriota bacterium]